MVESGVLVLNKPVGISSFLAVKLVGKILGASKVGHMGTLDPLADGVLVVGINKGTKLFDKFLNCNKEYVSVFKFGETSDSFDLGSEVKKINDKIISREELEKVMQTFKGKQSQMPPAYSAKKINGRRACDLVRDGKEVSLSPKEVEIFDFSILEELGENKFKVKISCSSGTYVRSLARDVAEKLTTCGMCHSITRTRCGVLRIESSYTLDDLRNGNFKIIPMEEILEVL